MGLDFLHRQCQSDNGPKFHIPSPPSSSSSFQRSPSFTSSGPTNGGGSSSSSTASAQGPVPLLSLSLGNHNAPLPGKPRAVVPKSASTDSYAPTPASTSQPQSSSPGNRSLKQRVNSILIQTLNENTEKDYNTHPSGQKRSEERSRSSILSNLTIITYRRKSREVVDYLLQQDFLGVDCEGVNLGIDGRVTLVQVAIPDGAVFIFDLLSEALHEDIRRLMESDILKVKFYHANNT